jgi:hypothetical protein
MIEESFSVSRSIIYENQDSNLFLSQRNFPDQKLSEETI